MFSDVSLVAGGRAKAVHQMTRYGQDGRLPQGFQL